MNVCELLVTKPEGQLVVGALALANGKVISGYCDGYENTVQSVLNAPAMGIKLEDDPVGWFWALPKQYTGSYFRASILGGQAANKR